MYVHQPSTRPEGLLLCRPALDVIFVLTACVYAWPRVRGLEADLPGYAAVADS